MSMKQSFLTVASRFASEYGMMRLSIGEAVRYVLTQQPKTELARLINAQVRKGIPLPDELSIRALEVNLLDTRSTTRGWVASEGCYLTVFCLFVFCLKGYSKPFQCFSILPKYLLVRILNRNKFIVTWNDLL